MPMHFMDGGGHMGAAMRALDWTGTPLGPPVDWSPTLKTMVALILGSQFPKSIVWGPYLTTLYNDAFRPILGDKPEALGRPFNLVWAEVWDTIGPIAEKAYAGEATFLEDYPLTINRHGRLEEAWFTFCYSPIRDEFGRVQGMMDTVVETTGKVRTEQRNRLLNGELAHRMKNMLAIVQSIASQTFRSAEHLDDARSVFEQRIRALATGHDMLTRADWSGASVEAVIRSTLAPHMARHDMFEINGPPVQLGGKRVLSLALAIHELATNAVKYGALSSENGRISIDWQAGMPGSDEAFLLSWEESGGPAVKPPTRTGFGSALIARVLPNDFDGEVEIDYRPEGLVFTLRTTMKKLDEAGE